MSFLVAFSGKLLVSEALKHLHCGLKLEYKWDMIYAECDILIKTIILMQFNHKITTKKISELPKKINDFSTCLKNVKICG